MAAADRSAIGTFPNPESLALALQALRDSAFSIRDIAVIAPQAQRQPAMATSGRALIPAEVSLQEQGVEGGHARHRLVGLGVPAAQARQYCDRIAQGHYLLLFQGAESEIQRAERILETEGIQDWRVYAAPAQPPQPGPAQSGSEALALDAPPAQGGMRPLDGGMRPLEHPFQRRPRAKVARSPWSERSRGSGSTLPAPAPAVPPGRESAPPARSTLAMDPVSAAPHPAPPDRARHQRAIGSFADRLDLEMGLDALGKSGFPIYQLSILVKAAVQPNGSSPLTNGDSRNYGTLTPGGHPLEGAAALMSGLSRIALPELGPALVLGPDSETLVQAAQRSTPGSDASFLQVLGLAAEPAHLYSRHLRQGAYLVTLQGPSDALLKAASTLSQYGLRDWGIFDISVSPVL